MESPTSKSSDSPTSNSSESPTPKRFYHAAAKSPVSATRRSPACSSPILERWGIMQFTDKAKRDAYDKDTNYDLIHPETKKYIAKLKSKGM